MIASPKEPNLNSSPTIPGTGNDHPAAEERTSELSASTTNKKPANHLLPTVIPQRAVDDGGVKSIVDTATASAPPQRSGEGMLLLGLHRNTTMMTADRASSYPPGSLGTNAMATATRLPQTELQMREEILLLKEQQRLVEQEILQQRLLIAEQRHREGLELLALRGVGPSATAATTGINAHLPRTPKALQRELLKVEAEELKQMQRQLQQQQQLAAQGGISPSILQLERELAMAEQAYVAEIMMSVGAEQAMQVRQVAMPTSHQPREGISLSSTSTVTSSTMTPSNSNPTKATTATKTKKTKRATSAATKTSTKEVSKKKRKVGRPIGSSAKAKERSKQLADASRLFQTESFLLGMAEVGPSDDFTMSPEMAASILGASKTTHAGLNAETTGATAQSPAVRAHPMMPGTAPPLGSCWVDPIPNSTSRSTFILPCSRQPSALLQAPTLESCRSPWSAIQSSLTNDTSLSPDSRHREALDQFLQDTPFAGVPIQNDTSIAGRYGVNSQGQVLQRMLIDGRIPHRVGAVAEHLQQQQQAHITASTAKPSPPIQPPTSTTVSAKKQAKSQNDQAQGKPKAPAASESKVSDYLTSTPNMMMLPLQQRSSLPRMA